MRSVAAGRGVAAPASTTPPAAEPAGRGRLALAPERGRRRARASSAASTVLDGCVRARRASARDTGGRRAGGRGRRRRGERTANGRAGPASMPAGRRCLTLTQARPRATRAGPHMPCARASARQPRDVGGARAKYPRRPRVAPALAVRAAAAGGVAVAELARGARGTHSPRSEIVAHAPRRRRRAAGRRRRGRRGLGAPCISVPNDGQLARHRHRHRHGRA